MNGLFNTLVRTVILDDTSYREWRDRPNLFLRGITLILAISLISGLITFAVNVVSKVQPVDVDKIEEAIEESFEQQFRWNPGWQEPEVREMMEDMIPVIKSMVIDITQIQAPLPRAIGGFFEAVGGYLSGALGSLGGWLFYGALVLIAVNLLGGSAKLPDFLGMVSLYVIPGLLGILAPVPCVGSILALVGSVWGLVVYVKAVAVATDLDVGKSVLAVLAPAIVLLLLTLLLLALFVLWMVIVL